MRCTFCSSGMKYACSSTWRESSSTSGARSSRVAAPATSSRSRTNSASEEPVWNQSSPSSVITPATVPTSTKLRVTSFTPCSGLLVTRSVQVGMSSFWVATRIPRRPRCWEISSASGTEPVRYGVG